ncbi:hypothetical protein [Salinivibrio sp. IB872]|jgi:hypothetical protein|uniref:hypothetical protein n=1 Tax=Salinivibrio sp. IB872 TaxID=1766123 RepID=UPI000986BEC3|nr:hypothetical protein [Salinivibrio sp. IB872]OOF22206.1 hypothetical protein BZJ18_15280 [Salinivibrio sp. IB872]
MTKIIAITKSVLAPIWAQEDELLDKVVDLADYDAVNQAIPDDTLSIEEVFAEDELEEIYLNFAPYLDNESILPFMASYGNAVFCLGVGEENQGYVYYFDLDFGLHLLTKDGLTTFVRSLTDA